MGLNFRRDAGPILPEWLQCKVWSARIAIRTTIRCDYLRRSRVSYMMPKSPMPPASRPSLPISTSTEIQDLFDDDAITNDMPMSDAGDVEVIIASLLSPPVGDAMSKHIATDLQLAISVYVEPPHHTRSPQLSFYESIDAPPLPSRIPTEVRLTELALGQNQDKEARQ